MPIKNLNSFSDHWLIVVLLAVGTVATALFNAWFGFPLFTPFEGAYSAIGGVIPNSDAEIYLSGSHRLIEYGYLDPWNMRRPYATLLLAFYLKITHGNFWYTIVLQATLCSAALALYLRTLTQDLRFPATFCALIFLCIYFPAFIHTTLSETLGLTLGLLSFVLLWNGWLERNRRVFNFGMASLAVALAARAGPNLIALSLLGLIYISPFSQSRLKDIAWSILSFSIPFFLSVKLASLFSDPNGGGMAFSNFGSTLYGLVNGGKGWLFAYENPQIKNLTSGKTELELAQILYAESWKDFKANPFNLIAGLFKNLWAFFHYFIKNFTFGPPLIRNLFGLIVGIFWIYIGIKIYKKRYQFRQEFLFLIFSFLGIAASSTIIFKDGGIRTFAVVIPFIGAFFGLAFASYPLFKRRKDLQNIGATSLTISIILASLSAVYIPTKMQAPVHLIPSTPPHSNQKVFLTYTPNKQPHLLIKNTSDLQFRTFSPARLESLWTDYYNVPFNQQLKETIRNDNNLAILYIYDYISHSNQWILAERDILKLNSPWVQIRVTLMVQDFKSIYKTNSFEGQP